MEMNNIERAKEYLQENTGELLTLCKELNSINSNCDFVDVFDFDDLGTYITDPCEAMRATVFGEVSYNDDYLRFDGYGNLESVSDYDLEREALDYIDEVIEAIVDCTIEHFELSEILEEEEEE